MSKVENYNLNKKTKIDFVIKTIQVEIFCQLNLNLNCPIVETVVAKLNTVLSPVLGFIFRSHFCLLL